MKKKLVKEIVSLPQLPNIIKEINNFRKNDNSNIENLIKILKKEPLFIINILSIANSNLFGCKCKSTDVNKAIEVLGIRLVLAICIGSIISKSINKNLLAYAVTIEEFFYTSALRAIFIDDWVGKIDENLGNELFLPAFLQDMGKFIISQIVQDDRQTEYFLKALDESDDITACELEFTGYSCSRISANIFKQWDFSHNIIFSIAFSEDLKNCPEPFLHKAQVLNVLRILCDIRNPLSNNSIEKALKKVLEYGFNAQLFLNSLDFIREKIDKSS